MKKVFLFLTVCFVFLVAKAQEEIYTVVDEMPFFKGCITHLNHADRVACSDEWILRLFKENIDYSKIPETERIKGTVYVSFIVNKLGEVGNTKVLRGIGGAPSSEVEAKRVILNLPDYMPGKQNGAKVNVKYTLPINFNYSKYIEEIKEVPELYTIVEDMPIWKGCEGAKSKLEVQECSDEKVLQFIKNKADSLSLNNFKKRELLGNVLGRYVINEMGKVVDVTVINSSGKEELDAAAVEIIKKLPDFTPGMQRGNLVNIQCMVSIIFK